MLMILAACFSADGVVLEAGGADDAWDGPTLIASRSA